MSQALLPSQPLEGKNDYKVSLVPASCLSNVVLSPLTHSTPQNRKAMGQYLPEEGILLLLHVWFILLAQPLT